jgi:hypothetical protein
MTGASAGRGFGNGTDAGSAARRRSLDLFSPNRSLQGLEDQTPNLRAAAADSICAQSISSTAAAVTIAA